MSIYKVAECDVCTKTEKFHIAIREWFIVNISHVNCTEACFLNRNKKKISFLDWRNGGK